MAGTPRTLPVLKRRLAGRPASKAFGTAEEEEAAAGTAA